MLVVQVDTVASYGSRASEATKKPKGSYCQAWPTPQQAPHSTSANTHGKTMWSATAICLSFARMYLSEWAEHIMLTINASHVQQQFGSS